MEGIISCIPIAVLIIGLLVTKRMAEMMILSSFIGAVLVYKGGFFGGWIGMMYQTLGNESYDFLLFILFGFGAMIKLFEMSGAFLGFTDIVSKIAKGPKSAMVATWLMGIIMFVDDYLNVLAVSSSMKTLTDKYNIPREHLAYGANSMGACVCVLIPITSWAAFAVGCMGEQGLGFGDYVRSLPFMFFPIFAILICLLVAVGIIPKVGPLKKAYERVEAGGPLLVQEQVGASIISTEQNDDEEVQPGSPWFFIVPIIVLIVVMMICNQDVVSGIIAAVASQGVLYIATKRMSLTDFMNGVIEGVTSMAGLAFVIFFGYVLNCSNTELGFSEFVVNGLSSFMTPTILPAFVFVIVGLVTFAAASFWILIMLTVPIFVPLAVTMGVDPAFVIAAIMSGVAFGSKFCFYSDAVFMTSAGTGVSNMTQIKVVAPYVLGAAGLAIIAFLVAGFVAV
ncbi:MAG: hypothetical protein HUJ79_01105 [Firmicutes bacterium]|nr:hypothetical protein [Bacillota bacterium]